MADLPPATEAEAMAEQLTLTQSSNIPSEDQAKSAEDVDKVEQPTVTYPAATDDQHLLLDGLHDDVLAIIVDFLFDMDELNGQHFYLYTNPGPYFRIHRSTLDLSVVNKRLRSACIRRLFSDIHRCSSSMGQLNRQLKDIELNPQLLSSARTCEIVTSSRYDSTLCKTRLPNVLASMLHLKELSITHRKDVDFSALDMTFARADVRLPTVVGLRIQCPGDWDFLVNACPNTEILVLRDNRHHEGLMQAAKDLEKLRHIELYDKAWLESDVDLLYDWFPNIESLALKGGIGEGDIEEWADVFGQFSRLRTLAMTTDPQQEDWQHELVFSDNSDVAMSIINARRSHGVDINLDGMASDYFEYCSKLETLYLWEFSSSTHTFTAERNDEGGVTAVRDVVDFDKFYATLDQDGFPKTLSFPGEILSYDANFDPPKYGRATLAEREEEEAREKEKAWYVERWARWHSNDPDR